MKNLLLALTISLGMIGCTAKAEVSIPKGYTLQFNTASFAAPADATVYYLGGLFASPPDATVGVLYLNVPKAGVIRSVFINVISASGTSETSTMRLYKNGGDSDVISSVITTNAPATFSNTAMGVTVAAGDLLAIKWTTPTWATNPTNMPGIYGVIYVDVP